MKRILRLFTLALCLTLIATTAFALPENYVVRNGDREQKKVAITVDDCYNHDMIRAIHELSVELDFPVTWFAVGYEYLPEEKELWEDIIAHGSELGNHTWKHSRLIKHSVSNTQTQIRLAQERLDEVLGYHYPLRLLRPPYGEYKGEYNNAQRSLLNVFYSCGVEKVILWDVSNTDPQKAFKATKNGSILLYHTNKKDYECLKVLVPMLREAGYELVTISELLGLEPLVLEIPAEEPTTAPN